VERPFN